MLVWWSRRELALLNVICYKYRVLLAGCVLFGNDLMQLLLVVGSSSPHLL